MTLTVSPPPQVRAFGESVKYYLQFPPKESICPAIFEELKREKPPLPVRYRSQIGFSDFRNLRPLRCQKSSTYSIRNFKMETQKLAPLVWMILCSRIVDDGLTHLQRKYKIKITFRGGGGTKKKKQFPATIFFANTFGQKFFLKKSSTCQGLLIQNRFCSTSRFIFFIFFFLASDITYSHFAWPTMKSTSRKL